MGYVGSAGAAVRVRTLPFCIHTFPLRFSSFRHYFERKAHTWSLPFHPRISPNALIPKSSIGAECIKWLADQEVRQVDPKGITLLAGSERERHRNQWLVEFRHRTERRRRAPPFRNTLPGISLTGLFQELCSETEDSV